MEGNGKSSLFKAAKTRLFYALIILSSFFIYCGDEPDEQQQQFAVWRGGEAVPVWVDVYRPGTLNIFIADYTGEPDKTVLLTDEQLKAMDSMEADFGKYLNNYPSVVCDFDGDFTYRVILTTIPSDTTWTCGTTNPAIPHSLSTGLNIINELIGDAF